MILLKGQAFFLIKPPGGKVIFIISLLSGGSNELLGVLGLTTRVTQCLSSTSGLALLSSACLVSQHVTACGGMYRGPCAPGCLYRQYPCPVALVGALVSTVPTRRSLGELPWWRIFRVLVLLCRASPVPTVHQGLRGSPLPKAASVCPRRSLFCNFASS